MIDEQPVCDRRMVGRHGFTLIELLVVIAIISLLAALIFPAISSSLSKSYEVNCRNNLRQIAAAIMMRADDADGYFPSVANVGPDGSYFGKQTVLLDAVKSIIGRDAGTWFCPHTVKLERINAKTMLNEDRIGYFYWAWTLNNSAPAPVRPESLENIWMIQGWNNTLGQLVLLTDQFRDKNAWGYAQDRQYHAGGTVDMALTEAGTLAVMGDGSVQKIAPRH